MTEEYLKQFERWVSGPKARKAQVRAELEEHLRAAEAAGDVDALARLGTPREAAETFSSGHETQLAPLTKRIVAALLDMGMTFVLVFGGLALGSWNASPQGIGAHFEGPNMDFWTTNVLAFALVVAGGLWWAVVLTLLEWRFGQTLGKRLFGLRVLAESGTAPSFGQVVVRRLTMIFSGPLQTIDWAFMFFTKKHQRAFDIVAHTVVVADERTTTERLEVAPAA